MLVPESMKSCRQWVAWRLEERDGKGSKIPYQINGQRASSMDPRHWTSFEQACQFVENTPSFSGLGFVFSQADDFVGIDLDNCFGEDGSLDEWARDVLSRFPSYCEISPSAKGMKIFCRGTLASDRGRRLNIPGKPGAHLEVYSSGRYFTVTGQAHGDCMETVNCQDGLDWLAAVVLPASAPPPAPIAAPAPRPQAKQGNRPDAEERARLYARSYPPAVSGQDGHGVTFRLACVLVTGFGLGANGARPILQEWNMGCQPPWGSRELEHKLNQAEKAGQAEGGHGWMLEDESVRLEQSAVPVSVGELDAYEVFLGGLMGKAQASRAKTGFPEHLYNVPGFMKEVSDYITDQNPRKNPILSLVAAVALQGVLIGAKYKDRTGNRSNLYFVLLAPSSGGKQAPMECIEKILNASNGGNLYGGKVSSDSALASDLMVSRSKLYIWDEFGRFLDKTRIKTGGAHLHAVQEALLELWGKTSGVWKQKSYADSKNNKEIYHPCCSFLGLTVPSTFWDGLEEGHLSDGFAARMMVIDSGPRLKFEETTEKEPPKSILEKAAYWINLRPGGNLGGVNPEAILVPETPAATAIFRKLVNKAEDAGSDETENSIWGRAIQKARRLALIYACSRDQEAPVIDDQAAQWGVDFSTWCTDRFIAIAKDEVASDDPAQQKWQRIRKVINAYTKRNQLCSRSALLRTIKWHAKDLDKILDTMVQAHVIEAKQVPAANGKFATYYSVKG